MVKNRVRENRHKQGLTLVQLSKLCAVAISTLSEIERGTEPFVTTAQRIARALGMTVDDLWLKFFLEVNPQTVESQ